jgi:hypothetical protein
VKVHKATLEEIFALSLFLFLVTSEDMKRCVLYLKHICIFSELFILCCHYKGGKGAIINHIECNWKSSWVWLRWHL